MFKPLNNKVLVKPIEENRTPTGFILPDEDKPNTGIVVVGNDLVKDGDRVLFSRYASEEFEINGEKMLVVSSNCLMGIFK